MLELLLLTTFAGVVLASHRRMGFANPFQIYFFIWFLVFLGYYSSSNSFIKVQPTFLMLLLAVKLFAFLCLIIVLTRPPIKSQGPIDVLNELKDNRLIFGAQIAVFLLMPFAYMKALSLSGGVDLFSVLGYVLLRSAMTEDGQGFGLLAYASILSYILSSITVTLYAGRQIGITRLVFSIVISSLYAYLGTARTGVLLLLILIFIPLIITKKIKLKGILFLFLLIVVLFSFFAAMTAKGISFEASFWDNVDSYLQNMRSYTVAPLLALYQFLNSNISIALGANTFRLFVGLASSVGLIDGPLLPLIREYAYVPDPTNVYTVYEVYVRDFSYIGMFIPAFFLIAHWYLYRNALRTGSVWIFYYAASVYPLAMQFFHDQYFSLLSIWIQLGFWYWLFLRAQSASNSRMKVHHA